MKSKTNLTTDQKDKALRSLFKNGQSDIGTKEDQINILIQYSLIVSDRLNLINDFIDNNELTEELEEYINENW